MNMSSETKAKYQRENRYDLTTRQLHKPGVLQMRTVGNGKKTEYMLNSMGENLC
jgi:hypothetical protein